MKIIFEWWSLWSGRNSMVVHIRINKDGYWSKRSQDDLLSAMREAKGIEIEEAEEIQVDNFIKELRDRTKELKRLNKEYKGESR